MLCSCWAGDLQTMCYSWPQRDGDLNKQKEEVAGRTQMEILSMPTNKQTIRGSNSLSPRGEGGEGRVRNWGCIQRFRFSFVHVFNGYVASLSMTLTKTYDL